jgi:AraC-like DNA-binding protein
MGEPIRRINLDGFVLTEAKHKPALSLQRHMHEYACITMVLQGSYTERLGRHREECRSRSLIFKPPGEDHADDYGQAGAHSLVVEVTPRKLTAIRASSQALDEVFHARSGALSGMAIRIYKEFKLMDSASPLSIEGLVLEILGQMTRQKLTETETSRPHWLATARDFIHDHFAEPVSLATVAAAVDVDPAHLSRVFRKHFRSTMGNYIRRIRIEKAMEDLLASEKSIAEIALRVGFYDQSHLNNSFKSVIGITPAEFRRETRVSRSYPGKQYLSKTSRAKPSK